jgi:UDP-N-acetylmuramate: L-alanyl-gamma-D-glutamyl-meso-diaminopimelate ligase
VIPYSTHPYAIRNGITCLLTPTGEVPLRIFGKHNLQNISGALEVCRKLGLSDAQFYDAIKDFEGAARRLEPVFANSNTRIYKDFAHSPSKLKATTEAVREQFPENKLIACMELHTFSSLNKTFLEEYKGSMLGADCAYVYFNPHTVEHKKLDSISCEQVKAAFGTDNVEVFNDSELLLRKLQAENWNDTTLLMMTSGNFDGLRFEELPALLGLK